VLLLAGFLALKIFSLWAVALSIDICRQRWLFAFLLSQGGEFAFVVFETAREAKLFTAEWEALLTITVALSMATTPLLLLAHDKLMGSRATSDREPDTITDEGPVIIAGFGRFGQIVGRLLLASGVRPVVLDHDPDQVDALRRVGFTVFYGDATRLDLLEAAGARKARLIVNAIDDVEASLALVDRVQANFPSLAIVSRARNVSHYFELRIRGVDVVERETFESALRAGRSVLEKLGADRFRAKELADVFRRYNIASVDAMLPFYKDEARRLSLARQGVEEMERQFARDREQFERGHGGGGWK
jgi:glutathione-regulated potassium-efflux system ancillary protein KefC